MLSSVVLPSAVDALMLLSNGYTLGLSARLPVIDRGGRVRIAVCFTLFVTFSCWGELVSANRGRKFSGLTPG